MKDGLLIGFGIPAILIVGSFILIGLGIDGEVKSVMLMAAGWCFRSGYQYKKEKNASQKQSPIQNDEGGL